MTQANVKYLNTMLSTAVAALAQGEAARALSLVEGALRLLAKPVKPRATDLDSILPRFHPDGSRCMARVDYEDALSWATSPDPKVRERGTKLARAILKSAREEIEYLESGIGTRPVFSNPTVEDVAHFTSNTVRM